MEENKNYKAPLTRICNLCSKIISYTNCKFNVDDRVRIGGSRITNLTLIGSSFYNEELQKTKF